MLEKVHRADGEKQSRPIYPCTIAASEVLELISEPFKGIYTYRNTLIIILDFLEVMYTVLIENSKHHVQDNASMSKQKRR